MHFGLRTIPLRSLKDFLAQFVMIVLGVLTALALDAWVQHVRHAQAAAVASNQIRQELQVDLGYVERVRAHDAERLKQLEQLRASLIHDVQAGLPDAVVEQHILARSGDFGFGLNVATTRHEAWDMAVANQSIDWIDKAELRRYATLYARLDAYATSSRLNLQLNMQDTNINDVFLDMQTRQIQPRNFLYTLNRMTSAMHDAVNLLDGLQRDFTQTMPALQASAPSVPH